MAAGPVSGSDDPGLARVERERLAAAAVEAARTVGPGRLSPRQRVERLLDAGSFFELGALAASQQPGATGPTPGDGLITGFGSIDGLEVATISEDPLVLARTDGQVAKSKRRRLLKLARQQQLPIVWFVDGPDGPLPIFPATGGQLYGGIAEQYDDVDVRARRASMIGVVLGSATGQARELLARCDVLVATKISPPGGGHEFDVDVVVDDEADAVAAARALVRLDAERAGAGTPAACPPSPVESPGALAGVPASESIAEQLADPGTWMAFARREGSGLISGILKLAGIPIAIAVTGASGQRLLGRDDLDGLQRVVAISGRYGIPLLLVQDCDGYAPELMLERSSARAVSDLVDALRSLPAPLVSLVAGAGHVLGTYCLGGRQVDPSYVLAWPWARIGVTDTPAYDAGSLGAYRQPDPWLAAGMGLVDDVVTPEETVPWLRWFVRLAGDRRHLPPIPPDTRWYARSSIKGT
ncbi:MAG TPA: carboxyl transferase domain-containing protein [Acidimicrobiales bacterium]